MTLTSDRTWPGLIATMVEAKSQLSEADHGFWPYHLPEIRASNAALAAAETALSLRLPRSYRDFLNHANGWRGFFHTINLLSCEQLVAGTHRERADDILSALAPQEWQSLNLQPESVLAIGVSIEEVDLFIIDYSRHEHEEAPIVWIAGDRIDEWPTFVDFFSSMIEYNRRELQHFVI